MSDPGHRTIAGEPLTATDHRGLEARWISLEWADRARLFRVDSWNGSNLIGRNGNGNYEGFAIPYIWPGSDRPREYVLRRDHPDLEQGRDGTIKQKGKYLWPPGRKNQVYFPPGTDPAWLGDVSISAIIVEGPLKAIALARYFEERGEKKLVVALSGVSNWRGTVSKTADENGARVDVKGPIPDLDRIEWRDRDVTILFDRNVRDNDYVRIARARLATELRGRGAKVSFVELPEDFQGNGVDDFLAEHGPDALTELFAAKPAPTDHFETGITLADFYAYSPDHKYICIPTGEIYGWPPVLTHVFSLSQRARRTKRGKTNIYQQPSGWIRIAPSNK